MKQIINDLLYDTETSELIYVDAVNNRRMYRTQNNNYFVLYGNSQIVPKTEESAKDYLGKYAVKKYIELFGQPKEA